MRVFTEKETREFVAHQERRAIGTNLLIENEQGQLLVLRNNYESVWGVPGGWMERDESPRQAVIRETFEETGLRVDPAKIELRYLMDMDHPYGAYGQILVSVFSLQQPLSQNVTLVLQDDEIEEYAWISKEEVLNEQPEREYTLAIHCWANNTRATYLEFSALTKSASD